MVMYPKGPPTGTVVQEYGNVYREIESKGLSKYRAIYKKNEIENYPINWEDVSSKVKEYSIIEVISNERSTCAGRVSGLASHIQLSLMYTAIWDIHKVRKLDGTYITLGDKVKDHNSRGKIVGFEIPKEPFENKLRCRLSNGSGLLLSLVVPDIVIMETEDKYPLHKGDDYYYIHLQSFRIDASKAHVDFLNNMTGGLCYKSRAKAIEYVQWNKPILTLKEVSESWAYCESKFDNEAKLGAIVRKSITGSF